MQVIAALLVTLCGMLIPYSVSAGAWTQPAGNALLATSATYYASEQFFDNQGAVRKQQRYRKHELSSYGEWGYSDTITLGANLFANRASQSGQHNYAVSNAEFFARQRVYHTDKRVVSLQPLIKLPTYARDGNGPQSGSKSLDIELALLYGESLHILSDRDFMDTAIALRARTDGLSPQWRIETKYGIVITDALTIISGLYITQSINLKTPTRFREGGDFDYHLTKAEISALYATDAQRYWQLNGFNHIAGTQAGAGYGVSLTHGMRF